MAAFGDFFCKHSFFLGPFMPISVVAEIVIDFP